MFNSVKKRQLKNNIKIIFAGSGGQGVLTASTICAHAFLYTGYDVKKSDIKGIARRGGKVISSLIAGEKVHSPKINPAMADIAVMLSKDIELIFSGDTVLVSPADEEIERYHKSLNIFCLGKLSILLDIPVQHWEQAIKERFEDGVSGINLTAFYDGRQSAKVVKVS